jgi:hypothetical protein
MSGFSGAANGSRFGGNADALVRASHTQNTNPANVSTTAAKATSATTKTDDGGKVAGAAHGSASAAPKPTSSVAATPATHATSNAPPASQVGGQLAGSTSAAKNGVDTSASGQGTASHGSLSSGGDASADLAVSR